MSYVVCGFYTENTVYEEIATKYLLTSSKELGLDYDVVSVPNLGNWQRNTSYKATFALEMLKKHPDKNIILLDADARIESVPILFDNIPEHYIVAAHYLDHQLWFHRASPSKEFLSGTLFLRNTKQTYDMVQMWIDKCKIGKEWEQRVLAQIIKQFNFPIYHLPVEYCWLHTLPAGRPHPLKDEGVVIRHFQASRWTKQQINKKENHG